MRWTAHESVSERALMQQSGGGRRPNYLRTISGTRSSVKTEMTHRNIVMHTFSHAMLPRPFKEINQLKGENREGGDREQRHCASSLVRNGRRRTSHRCRYSDDGDDKMPMIRKTRAPDHSLLRNTRNRGCPDGICRRCLSFPFLLVPASFFFFFPPLSLAIGGTGKVRSSVDSNLPTLHSRTLHFLHMYHLCSCSLSR